MAVLFCRIHKLFSKGPWYDVTLLNPAGKEAWGPLQEADRQDSQVPEVRDGGILAPQLYRGIGCLGTLGTSAKEGTYLQETANS